MKSYHISSFVKSMKKNYIIREGDLLIFSLVPDNASKSTILFIRTFTNFLISTVTGRKR